MLGDVVGHCTVKKTITKTSYYFGSLSDLEGKTLQVMEQARSGDCLCLNPTKTGLVDVNIDDIEKFIPCSIPSNPFELIEKLMKMRAKQ